MGIILAAGAMATSDRLILGVLCGCGGGMLVGFWEDAWGLAIRWRLVGLTLVLLPTAVIASSGRGLGTIGPIAILVAMLAYTNAYNFMDGINGISAIQAVTAAALFALEGAHHDLSHLRTLAIALLAAVLGFVPFNFPRAYIFLGDSGSYALGACIAGLAVALWSRGVPYYCCIAPLALYGADTASTLLRRAARREPISQPHREHVYQKLVDTGCSQLLVTAAIGAILVACSVLAVGVERENVEPLIAICAAVTLLGAYLASPTVVARSRRERP